MTTDTDRVRIVCRADALKVGDQVRTPDHRWETVTGLDPGEAYSRSTRVFTDVAGPDFPWVWINRHTVTVHRPAPAAA